MLVLSRRLNESIVIDKDIIITVIHIGGGKVKLGIEAPQHITVNRSEVHEEIERHKPKSK